MTEPVESAKSDKSKIAIILIITVVVLVFGCGLGLGALFFLPYLFIQKAMPPPELGRALPIDVSDEQIAFQAFNIGVFELDGGEKRSIDYATAVPVDIGLLVHDPTDSAGVDLRQPQSTEARVALVQKDGNRLAHAKGGTALFKPVDGQLKLTLENLTTKPIKVTVFVLGQGEAGP